MPGSVVRRTTRWARWGSCSTPLAEAIAALTREVRDGATATTWRERGRGRRPPQPMRPRRVAQRPARARRRRHDDLVQIEGEWLNYAALLVQVDRIVADLAAPLPE